MARPPRARLRCRRPHRLRSRPPPRSRRPPLPRCRFALRRSRRATRRPACGSPSSASGAYRGGRSAQSDRIYAGGVEGIMPGQPRYFVIRCGVRPYGVLRPPHRAVLGRHLNRPIGGFSLVGTAGVVFGRAQQIEPDILLWEIVHRPVTGLLAAQRRSAVGDGHTAEDDLDAPALRHKVDAIVGAGGKTWSGVRHFDFLLEWLTAGASGTLAPGRWPGTS